MATKAEIAAAQAAESRRIQNLANAQAQAAAAQTKLAEAQVGAKGKTGDVIFEKALAGISKSNLDAGAARGLAAMSARYGLQAAALNAYTGENGGYNISEQTKAEQAALDAANQLVSGYSTPINIPQEDKKPEISSEISDAFAFSITISAT